MKSQLTDDLIMALRPILKDAKLDDVKMRITLALADYEVTKAKTDLAVYEGDVNELILKRFLSAKIAAGLSSRTIQYYGETIKQTLERIGKPYNDVTADDIRLYLAVRIHKDGISKVSADNERRNLSSFYGWLQKEEILLRNPMAKVDFVKKTKQKKKAYSIMDLERIRMGCRDARERALIEFLSSTWCRCSELAEVKISDIRGNQLEVHGKGDKYRTVYLNARATIAIQEYLRERSDTSPYLFPKCNCACTTAEFKDACRNAGVKGYEWWKVPELVGGRYSGRDSLSTIENTVRNIGKRAGVEKVHPHRFRRTGATLALRQGMPLLTVSKLLGHESVETTQIYLDISDKELEQAHERYVI